MSARSHRHVSRACASAAGSARRALLAGSFVWSIGCAHGADLPNASTTALDAPDARVTRLENENRALSEEVRALRAQLALARGDETCPASTVASAPSSVEPPRESVRIGRTSGDEATTVEPALDEARAGRARTSSRTPPTPTASSEGDRPVLRLYGSPALPLDGSGYITVRERLPAGPDVRPIPVAPTTMQPAPAVAPMPTPVAQVAASAPSPTTPTVRPTPTAPSTDPAQEEYRTALAHVSARRFHEANEELTRFLARHPDHPYTDNALYWRGTVAYAERRYGDARRDFERVVAEFSRGNKVADALYHLGMCHLRMGERDAARAYFRRVQSEHPNTVAARLAAREDA